MENKDDKEKILKELEMIPILEKRIKTCKDQVNKEIYQQY